MKSSREPHVPLTLEDLSRSTRLEVTGWWLVLYETQHSSISHFNLEHAIAEVDARNRARHLAEEEES